MHNERSSVMDLKLPAGLDYAWFGYDADGYVARFTNAGAGPIPVAVLAAREIADRAEGLARLMPFVCEYEMRVNLPDPTDFINTACKGIFTYDWQDVVRTADQSQCYEIVSRPIHPLRIDELPVELQDLAFLAPLAGARFGTDQRICVDMHLDCVR